MTIATAVQSLDNLGDFLEGSEGFSLFVLEPSHLLGQACMTLFSSVDVKFIEGSIVLYKQRMSKTH